MGYGGRGVHGCVCVRMHVACAICCVDVCADLCHLAEDPKRVWIVQEKDRCGAVCGVGAPHISSTVRYSFTLENLQVASYKLLWTRGLMVEDSEFDG